MTPKHESFREDPGTQAVPDTCLQESYIIFAHQISTSVTNTYHNQNLFKGLVFRK